MRGRLHTAVALLAATALPGAIAQVSWADPLPPGKGKPAASASASASGSPSAAPPASASASAIPAPSTLAAEIMVLHASNSGGGIDPRIGNMPQLKKPPFSAYDTYKLLGQSKVSLAGGRQAESTLPNDGTLQLSLREVVAPGRFKVATTIRSPKGRTVLPLLETVSSLNEPFFVAGQSYREGVLVVGIKLVK